MRFTAFASAIALFLICGCDGDYATAPAPTLQLPAVPGRPGAGYFELRLYEDSGDLVSVTSPQVGRIEMHQTMNAGNMTSMRPISRIPAHSGDKIVFQPGGYHLMLFDIDPTLQPGGQAQLTFHFTKGEPRTLGAAVLPAGESHGGH
jgi:periplasmic copper chaperone A